MADEHERRQRALARRVWPVTKTTLSESTDDLSATTTAAQRIGMMWPLAKEAWRISGRTIPSYERREITARRFGPGDAIPDADAG